MLKNGGCTFFIRCRDEIFRHDFSLRWCWKVLCKFGNPIPYHQPSTAHSFVNHVWPRVWDYHPHVLLRITSDLRVGIKLQSVQMIQPSLNGRQPPPAPCDEWNVVGFEEKDAMIKVRRERNRPTCGRRSTRPSTLTGGAVRCLHGCTRKRAAILCNCKDTSMLISPLALFCWLLHNAVLIAPILVHNNAKQ